MSHLVLARKYRPDKFSEVLGQRHITQTLLNTIQRDKVAHAYLFAGPRGVGKTTIARIFAKAINCTNPQNNEPCLECDNCKEIARGVSIAVREIDGASHNSVDNVRDLIETFNSLPPPNFKFKVYIIDEVHMLSVAAFNALLKSLEEPPANTVFILATTEPHKILPTVISRCQRFDLRALSLDHVEACLKEIAETEQVEISPEVLRQISRLSEGSVRDAQSMLEKVFAYNDKKVTADSAAEALGIIGKQDLLKLSAAIFSRNIHAVIAALDHVFSAGFDPIIFLKEFVTHWRELLIAKRSGAKALESLGLNPDLITDLLRQVEPVDVNDVHDLTDLARTGADQALRSNYLRYSLESLLLRLATREPLADFAAMLNGVPLNTQKKKPEVLLSKATPEVASLKSPEIVSEKIPVVKAEVKKQVAVRAPVNNSLDDSNSVVSPAGEKTELNWREFILSLDSAKPILLEHLRRVAIKKFEEGSLQAEAPEITVQYLNQSVNQRRLEALLSDFCGQKNWKINLKPVSTDAGDYIPGSIRQEDRKTSAEEKQKTLSNLMKDPNIKAIKDLFPNSELESG